MCAIHQLGEACVQQIICNSPPRTPFRHLLVFDHSSRQSTIRVIRKVPNFWKFPSEDGKMWKPWSWCFDGNSVNEMIPVIRWETSWLREAFKGTPVEHLFRWSQIFSLEDSSMHLGNTPSFDLLCKLYQIALSWEIKVDRWISLI